MLMRSFITLVSNSGHSSLSEVLPTIDMFCGFMVL